MGKKSKSEAEKALKKARKRVRKAEEEIIRRNGGQLEGTVMVSVPYPPLAIDGEMGGEMGEEMGEKIDIHFSSGETERDCRNGVHCLDTEHSCNIDWDHDDHSKYCCSCGVRMLNRAPMEDDEAETLIMQALGTASMCWERIDRAGIFESERCASVGDQLLKELGIVSTRPKHEKPYPKPTMKVAEELGPKGREPMKSMGEIGIQDFKRVGWEPTDTEGTEEDGRL